MKLSPWPRTVRGLSIVVATISGLVMLLIGAATVYTSHEEIEAQIDQRIELEMEALLAFRATHSTEELARVVQARDGVTVGHSGYLADVDGAYRIMGYAVSDAHGHRLAGSLIARIPPDGWDEFLPIRRPDGTRGFAQALTRSLPDGGHIVVAGDRLSLNRTDHRIIVLILIGLGTILLTGIIGTFAFGRLVHGRLQAISDTAQAIMEGNYARRVPLDGSGSEFDRLSHILNDMLARIETLMRNLQQVSSDIAHDMRTPITRIRHQMDGLLGTEDRPASIEAIRRMIADTDALLDLFTGLLGVSEVEGFVARRRFRPVALDEVVDEIVEAYRPTFDEEDRYLSPTLMPVTVNGDEQLLKRALANILENVLAHAGPGAGVIIDLAVVNGMAELRVADDGIGIAYGAEKLIFERLTRLDPSRGRPGHGLGLAMVRAIALAHRGTAEVDPIGRGLTLVLRFPLTERGTVA
jgi:signal transduction histidine kinase